MLCGKYHIWYVCEKKKKKRTVSHCLKCDSARSHWGTAELWYDAYQSSPYFHYYLKAQLIMSTNIRFFHKEGKIMADTHPIIATSLLGQTEKYPRMYPLQSKKVGNRSNVKHWWGTLILKDCFIVPFILHLVLLIQSLVLQIPSELTSAEVWCLCGVLR